MSVKELVLGNSAIKLILNKFDDKILLKLKDRKDIAAITLDHNQAHLLMLYLQERLALPAVSDSLEKAIDAELKDRPKDIMK